MTQLLFFTALYVLGLVLSRRWAAKLGWAATTLLAYPVGAAAWAFTAMMFVGLALPFTAVTMTVTLSALALGYAALLLVWKELAPRAALTLAATVPAFALICFAITQVNYAEFSFDSHYILVIGKGLGFEGGIAGRLGSQLAEWGAFQLMLHSAAELYGAQYFFAAE